LVEQVVDETGARRHQDVVDGHLVALDVDPPTQLRDLAVHGDPTVFDQQLARAPAAETATREHLLQAIAGRLAHSSPVRNPCSSTSTTSGPGTNAPNGGRSSTVSSPSRSRNRRLVPYSTARPGPGSRPIS